jgi:hypothetical protein
MTPQCWFSSTFIELSTHINKTWDRPGNHAVITCSPSGGRKVARRFGLPTGYIHYKAYGKIFPPARQYTSLMASSKTKVNVVGQTVDNVTLVSNQYTNLPNQTPAC